MYILRWFGLIDINLLGEGFFLYSLIEMKQRFGVQGPINPDVDVSLGIYDELNENFSKKWTTHHCNKPGCGTVLVLDGGVKANRKICAAKESGVRFFPATGIHVATGCTNFPGDMFATFLFPLKKIRN